MQPHLTDEALNEYLDEALPPDQRADAAAHLAHCQPCTMRLDALRALFTDLAALPDVALTRDLAPAVLAKLPAQAPALLPTRVRRRAGPWLLAAEVLAAAILLVVAWPLIAQNFAAFTTVPVGRPPIDLSSPIGMAGFWFASLQGEIVMLISSLLPDVELHINIARDVTPLLIGSAVAGAAMLWLVGNGLLLRRSLASRLRRRA